MLEDGTIAHGRGHRHPTLLIVLNFEDFAAGCSTGMEASRRHGSPESCINPVLYVFFSRDFKDRFFKSIPARLEKAFSDRYLFNMETTDDNQSHENYTAGGNDTFYVSSTVFPYLKAFCITCYSFACIVGILGNGLIIWIAGFKMKTVSAVWFLNLAIADFLCCSFLPFAIVEWSLFTFSYFPEELCKISVMALILNMCSSVYFLTIISIDRCVSILRPIWAKLQRTRKLAHIISGMVWGFCLILSVPFVVIHNLHLDFSDCMEKSEQIVYSSSDRYVRMLRKTRFAIMFVLPFSVILVCYGLIFLKLKKRRGPKRSQHSYQILIAVVLCFFICWFPYYTWPLIHIGKAKYQLDNLINEIFICLAYFNSCINPILYVFFCRDFKDNVIKSIPARLESAFLDRSELQSSVEMSG
ncbi:PREDICTED: C3a anaphylatoxin chemotactic receptor-like [Nanorana parkeri]|uniref:C3a anaphylatoxin chemotactic receptor-like n=1 Tax=Nanorana parkeri TaxID=125878 RepID=UPI000854163A|nr:PREDICTED: C3a anaphylatoxin chemotactic receptor-like [Nanorana parkeri]